MPLLPRRYRNLLPAALCLALEYSGASAFAQEGALIVPPPPTSGAPATLNNGNQHFAPQRLPADLPQDAAGAAPEADKGPTASTYRFPHPANGSEWVVTVTPASKRESPAANAYRDAYAAIPYHRAEYLANPAYRHEAAMEIMFGQQRPTVIQKQQVPERIVNPIPVVERPYIYSRNELYGLYPRLRYGAWTEGPYIPMPVP